MHPSITLKSWIAAIAIVLAVTCSIFLIDRQRTDPTQEHLKSSLDAFNTSDFNTAYASIKEVLDRDPDNIQALLAQATTLAQEGSIRFNEQIAGTQAIQVARRVLELDPKNAEAWRIIGYANEIMQKYDEAHQAYAKAIELQPGNALAISQDAHAYDLEGDFVKAEAGYRKALTINPTLDQAQAGLARILVARGALDEALSIFESVAGSSPNSRVRAEAAYSAGTLWGAKGDLDKAQSAMQLATDADSQYALAWTGRGTVAFQKAMATTSQATASERDALVTESFMQLQRGISLNPNQSAAYTQLGTQLIILGRTEEGLKVLEETLAIIDRDITLSAPAKESAKEIVSALIKATRSQ